MIKDSNLQDNDLDPDMQIETYEFREVPFAQDPVPTCSILILLYYGNFALDPSWAVILFAVTMVSTHLKKGQFQLNLWS